MIDTVTLIVCDYAEYYDRGMEAFDAGKKVEDCPYIGINAQLWVEGFKYAEENP